MAPEQAGAGRRLVGPAADVYALGAVLYECLTGRPPFEGDSTLDVLERVRTADPVRPRRLDPTVPRDLETVCLRCLQKAPHERYATAAELADDLRRFREGRPVLARPVGPAARAWRLCRRNPVVAGLLAAVAVVLLTGLVAVTVFWRKAEENLALVRDRERDLNAALTLAEAQRQLAEERGEQERINFGWAQEAVDEMLTHVGEGLEDVPQAESARRRVLEKALALQQRFLAHRSADPTVRLELAQAHRRAAQIQNLFGRPDEARASADAGLAVLRESADAPTSERAVEEARLTSVRGAALYALRAYADAARDQRAARAIYEGLLAGDPTRAEVRHRAAQNDQQLGLSLMYGGDYPAAAEAYRSALRHLDALPADTPEVRHMRSRTLNRIGSLMRSSGKLGEAAESFAAAEALAAPLADEFSDRRDYRQELASILFNHGNVVVTDGKSGAEKALGLYGRALERYRGLTHDFPQDHSYRGALARCLHGRGLALMNLGRAAESRAEYAAAVREYQALQSTFPRLGGTYSASEFHVRLNLIDLLLAGKDHDAAEECLGHLTRIASQQQADAPGAASLNFQGQAAGKRAALLDARGKPGEAVPVCAEAIALHRKARSMVPRSNRYSLSLRREHLRLAGFLHKLGRYRELREAADDLAGDFPTDWEVQYESAGLLGRAVSLAADDRPFVDEAAAAAVERLATAAELFRRSGKVEGFLARVRADGDLAPLRDHRAFKSFLAGSAGGTE
jgi:serine/threonine-protein kinase